MAPKKAVGRPRVSNAKALGQLVTIRLDKATADRLDKYCKAQEIPATRAQAIRALVSSGLETRGF